MQDYHTLRITGFASCKATNSLNNHPSLECFVDQIRNGKWKDKVEIIRQLKADNNTQKHKWFKANKIPAFVLSGVCYTRSGGSFKHNGILCIDIDGKDNPELTVDGMKERVSSINCVAGWFVSPSGDGLKVIVKIKADEPTHKCSFLTAERLLQNQGLCIDKSGKDIRRLCIASYDPEAVLHPLHKVTTLDIAQRVIEGIKVTESTEDTDELSLSSSSTTSHRLAIINNKETVEKRLKQKELEANDKLKQDNKLSKLYFDHVAKYVKLRGAYAGKRNEVLVEMIPYLFRAVGEKRVMQLAMAYYDLNQSKFSGNTTRSEHEKEVLNLLQNTKERWIEELSDQEFSLLEKLPRAHSITAFRICRDLSQIEQADYPDGQFFIGQSDLARRLGAGNISAVRELNTLIEHGVIKLVKKGDQYSDNTQTSSKVKASVYEWLI